MATEMVSTTFFPVKNSYGTINFVSFSAKPTHTAHFLNPMQVSFHVVV